MNNTDKEILDIKDEKSLMKFLREPTIRIAEFVTGLLAAESKDWKLTAGRLLQSLIKCDLFTELGRQIYKYRENGKIKEDYFATNKTRASLYELLKFIDEKAPDEELFKAIKSIFFSGISMNSTELDEFWSYEFIKLVKDISGTEILILKAAYEIANDKANFDVKERLENKTHLQMRSVWRNNISLQMKLGGGESIVFRYEENLEKLGLISPREENNRFSGDFITTAKYRLTDMGYKFCEFMTRYE